MPPPRCTGGKNHLAMTYLGERFDEQGADLINDGVFGLELDTLQLA